SIRVFCRVRSPLSTNNWRLRSPPIFVESEKIIVGSAGTKKGFSVDRVFAQESTQDDVFMEVEPILRSALDGNNVCILAYGQTGTGKTYTMEGVNGEPGIVPRAIEELFRRVSHDNSVPYTLSMSMLEVYVGSIRDLLVPKQPSFRTAALVHRSNLSILTASNGAVEIEGLTDVEITDFKQANRWYSRGKRARSTSWTNVNETSSRSHWWFYMCSLTRITISQTSGVGERVSKLWLVDLGGSERLLKTGATGQTMDEGKAINLSLSALGDVISALKRKRSHIPYRNSKLTQILSDSLGDGSKVLMIVHISSGEDDLGETLCSLSFAQRVRSVESNREISEDLKRQKQTCIAELEQQINDIEEELENIRKQIKRTHNLIQEKKQLFPPNDPTIEDHEGSPRSPLVIGHGEITESLPTTEKTAKKTVCRSGPRFMASTVCSRQRQIAGGEVSGKIRTAKSVSRSNADFSVSQSFNLSGRYVISNLKNAKTNLVKFEGTIAKGRDLLLKCKPDNMSHNSIDSKSSSNKKVSKSHPNLKATLPKHRRRMSDLL
ncbi:Kinesin-2, partial [Ananas comosus]